MMKSFGIYLWEQSSGLSLFWTLTSRWFFMNVVHREEGPTFGGLAWLGV